MRTPGGFTRIGIFGIASLLALFAVSARSLDRAAAPPPMVDESFEQKLTRLRYAIKHRIGDPGSNRRLTLYRSASWRVVSCLLVAGAAKLVTGSGDVAGPVLPGAE